MGIKVSADGLSIVTTKSDGKCMATIPDVCKIPGPNGAIPIPFPNMVESKKTKMTSILTKMNGGKVACFGSYCEPSTGDEGGVLKGIVSGKTKGKGIFLMSSPTVMVEGRPVCRKSDMLIMNEINTLGLTGMNQEDISPPRPIEEPEEKTLEIELKDEDGNPIANEPYMVMHSGRTIAEGNLDANGQATIEGITSHSYKVRFPNQELVYLDNTYRKSRNLI